MLSRARYLLDTSAMREPSGVEAAERLSRLLVEGKLAVCSLVRVALVAGAPSDQREAMRFYLSTTTEPLPTDERDFQRALEVQALVDDETALCWPELVVAAVAERRALVILHHNAGFEQIAKVTGQSVEWVT